MSQASPSGLSRVDLVLTDMDDTLTFNGRLSARTYAALERLEAAGVRVVPVTAAPAGWCDQMVRMWPVTAVIGENGGFCLARDGTSVKRRFWHEPKVLDEVMARLTRLARTIQAEHPDVRVSDDQPFRRTSLALERPASPETARAVRRHLEAAGASATLNSIWALAWFGGYDKVKAARKFLPQVAGLDIDLDRDRILFVGDSANDAPMFSHIPKSAGVSTVVHHLADIPHPPAWITRGPGGEGFVEVADAILSARRSGATRTSAPDARESAPVGGA